MTNLFVFSYENRRSGSEFIKRIQKKCVYVKNIKRIIIENFFESFVKIIKKKILPPFSLRLALRQKSNSLLYAFRSVTLKKGKKKKRRKRRGRKKKKGYKL